MQTSPAIEQIKTLNGPRVCGISPVGKEKVYGGNDLLKSQVFSSEWKTKRVREDASGNREDGEEDDDELPCVIGESEEDCIWRGSRRSVGSSFHRQGAAYWKERLVICSRPAISAELTHWDLSTLIPDCSTCKCYSCCVSEITLTNSEVCVYLSMPRFVLVWPSISMAHLVWAIQ